MKFLLFVIYDILWGFANVCYIPFGLIKKKISLKAFINKLFPARYLKSSPASIWIQAVSVGEVMAVRSLLFRIKDKFPYRVVISTTTLTGKAVADRIYGSSADVIFFPFDITFALSKAIRRINPKIFIAIETEIWPNLFYRLRAKNIPVIVLNGRISDKAYSKYKRIGFFTKRILSMCSYIGAQNDYYRERFISLGACPGRVYISGNIKFGSFEVQDNVLLAFKDRYSKILKGASRYLFIAASTHNPEEKPILEVFKNLSFHFSLNLLIVPRHPERVKEVAGYALNYGFEPVMISRIGAGSEYPSGSVFILDTVGDLFYFYSLCDVCFVGGSLVNYGGHNILEPLYFRKPVIFGPYMGNFKEIEEIVLRNKAAVKIRNKSELEHYVKKIISDNSFREILSTNAENVFKKQCQVLNNNIEIIAGILSRTET